MNGSKNDKMLQFLEKNKKAISNPIIKSFLSEKRNYKLLDKTINNPTKENMGIIDRAFQKHYLRIRIISYISNLIYHFSIDYDIKVNRLNNRYTLILDKQAFDNNNSTFKDIIEDNPTSNFDEVYGNDLTEHIENHELYKAIKQLTEKQLIILQMRYLENMPLNEIAKQLNTSPQNISNQHSRAIKKLRELILGQQKGSENN